jgi:replicative DNA helicase
MGKSSLALQCIDGQTRAGMHVFLASLEMSAGACAARVAFQRMGISKEELNTLNRDDFASHCADVNDNTNITWYAGDNSRHIDDLVGAILDAQRERPIDMVWIDHLTKIKHRPGRENLAHRIGLTTKALAELALKIDAPVAVLCQLSRDGGTGDPPNLTDLRDSGEIEEDARWVWMLHWKGYYETPRPPAHVAQPFDIYQRKTQDEASDSIPMMVMQKCAKLLPRKFGPQS